MIGRDSMRRTTGDKPIHLTANIKRSGGKNNMRRQTELSHLTTDRRTDHTYTKEQIGVSIESGKIVPQTGRAQAKGITEIEMS